MKLDLEVSKISQQQEAGIGADLAFHLVGPQGIKRALFQAKVYDPLDDRLRCDSAGGWDKLWSQLVLMKQHSPRLSFLLIYVPGGQLNGLTYGFGTWEQGFRGWGRTQTPSRFGVTLVPVDSLMDPSCNWINSPPVQHLGDGRFRPNGISFGRLFLDMILCKRGRWESESIYTEDLTLRMDREKEGHPVHFTPYRQIGISYKATGDVWDEFLENLKMSDGELDYE